MCYITSNCFEQIAVYNETWQFWHLQTWFLNSTILGLLLLDVYLYKSIMILFNINVTAHMATCSFVSHVGPHWHIMSHGITWYQGSLPPSPSHRLSLWSCYCYTCCDATNVEYIYRTLNGVSISFALIVGKFFSIFKAQRIIPSIGTQVKQLSFKYHLYKLTWKGINLKILDKFRPHTGSNCCVVFSHLEL